MYDLPIVKENSESKICIEVLFSTHLCMCSNEIAEVVSASRASLSIPSGMLFIYSRTDCQEYRVLIGNL